MKKIKVLYITRKYPPMVGGMENFSYNLYKYFDRDKVDTDIISLGKSQKHLVWFLPYAFFRTLFSAGKYDIIFVGDALLSAIGFFTKLFHKDKTVIVNVFGLDITFKNPLYQFYLKLFYRRFDKYISISKETDKTLHKKGDFDSVIITPGVDIRKFDKPVYEKEKFLEKYGLDGSETVLMTAGRLVKRKGAEWFVRNVIPKLESENVRYLIAGSGGEKENIEAAIKDTHSEDKVKMLGRVSDEDLDALYKYADAFVMPNIRVAGDMEGFGIVAAEASLAGTLVIASGIEGIRDAVKNGKNGILLESGNAEQYAEQIKKLCADRKGYKEKAAQFAEYTKKHYSWKHICDEYIKLFEELCGNEH